MNAETPTPKDESDAAKPKADSPVPYPTLPADHPFYSQGPMVFFVNHPKEPSEDAPDFDDIDLHAGISKRLTRAPEADEAD